MHYFFPTYLSACPILLLCLKRYPPFLETKLAPHPHDRHVQLPHPCLFLLDCSIPLLFRLPKFHLQLPDPLLLLPLAALKPGEHADQVLNLLRLGDEVLREFLLRGLEVGGGVDALGRGGVRGGVGGLVVGLRVERGRIVVGGEVAEGGVELG